MTMNGRSLIQFAIAVSLASMVVPLSIVDLGALRYPGTIGNQPFALDCSGRDREVQIAQRGVLCCCRTVQGSQCCNYLPRCGGFVPGCRCGR